MEPLPHGAGPREKFARSGVDRARVPSLGSTPLVNAMLCNGAALINGEIVVEGGVRSSFTASGRPLRVAPIGVAAHLTVSLAEVARRHTLQLSLEDEDGTPIVLWDGPVALARHGGPLYVADYQVDVPARALDGVGGAGAETLRVSWCTSLTTLTVPALGHYQLVLAVDGIDARRLELDIVSPARRQ